MLFNSLVFIMAFLPMSWLGFRIFSMIGRRLAVAWLVVVSLLFYGWWDSTYVSLLIISIVCNHVMGRALSLLTGRGKLQNWLLAGGISANLLVLCYYKYLGALLPTLDSIGVHLSLDPQSIALPLGISFFTFTQIGYLIDAKAGLAKKDSFLDYALFVTFFPHLIAGPILHHREMLPQFLNPATYRFNGDNVVVGLAIFFIGLFKKVVLADEFMITTNVLFSHVPQLSVGQAWTAILSFALQIYFDFSGYTDMAIGLALMFNMRFPANFDSPYKATSMIEFWQRWHMTLTRYLALYIYAPIALHVARYLAKRGITPRQASLTPGGFTRMIAFPTITTMTLAGIWHGAGINFLWFGLLHGVFLTVNHLWRNFFPKVKGRTREWYGHASIAVVKSVLTIGCVLISYVFFRSSNTQNALAMLGSMSGLTAASPSDMNFNSQWGVVERYMGFWFYNLDEVLHFWKLGIPNMLTLIVTWALVLTLPNVLQVFETCEPSLTLPRNPAPAWCRRKPGMLLGIVFGLVAVYAYLQVFYEPQPFVYFKF